MNPPDPGDDAAVRPDFASLQAAAQWFADGASQPGPVQERLNQWLEQDPRHRAAWAYVQAVNADFDRLSGPGSQAAHTALSTPARNRRRTLGVLAALGTGGLGAWLVLRESAWPDAQTLFAHAHTGPGQIREVALAGGARAWLNASTRITIENTAEARRLRLLEGEVFIDSGNPMPGLPPQPPLIVETAHGQIQLLGTRVSVRSVSDAQSQASVYEGAVRITPAAALAAAATVSAGEQAEFSSHIVHPATTASAMRHAWVQGLLVAENMRLDDFLQELSRYRRGRLHCDPAVAGLRLDGVFPLTDTDRALNMLEQSLPVRVQKTAPWQVTVLPRR